MDKRQLTPAQKVEIVNELDNLRLELERKAEVQTKYRSVLKRPPIAAIRKKLNLRLESTEGKEVSIEIVARLIEEFYQQNKEHLGHHVFVEMGGIPFTVQQISFDVHRREWSGRVTKGKFQDPSRLTRTPELKTRAQLIEWAKNYYWQR